MRLLTAHRTSLQACQQVTMLYFLTCYLVLTHHVNGNRSHSPTSHRLCLGGGLCQQTTVDWWLAGFRRRYVIAEKVVSHQASDHGVFSEGRAASESRHCRFLCPQWGSGNKARSSP